MVKNMQVYCAMVQELTNHLPKLHEKLPKFNILTNFAFYEKDMPYHLKLSNNLLVDSGAFTFQQKGLKNISKFVKNYKKFINKYDSYPNIKGFFELDIDNLIGYENVLNIRRELQEVSNKIIPVWHKSLGISEYKKMCKEYEYVSISGVSGEDVHPKNMIHFVNTAHKYNAKIHGLGVSNKKILHTVPFDSVDATSWFKLVRFGGKFKGKTVNSNYIRKNRYKIILLELIQEIKRQEYYYNYWKKR